MEWSGHRGCEVAESPHEARKIFSPLPNFLKAKGGIYRLFIVQPLPTRKPAGLESSLHRLFLSKGPLGEVKFVWLVRLFRELNGKRTIAILLLIKCNAHVTYD